MKVRIVLDVELANDALAALATYAASLAKHAKAHPSSPFEWERHTRVANDRTEAFRKAVGNAELVDF
jgi:hypothetical protein